MTPPASCRGKAQGCGDEADEDYLVILSATLWASAPHSSSVFRLSCSVNHRFNIYLTIQYLPRRFQHAWLRNAAARILSNTRYITHLRVRLGGRRRGWRMSHLLQRDADARCAGTEPDPLLETCSRFVSDSLDWLHTSCQMCISIAREWLTFKV